MAITEWLCGACGGIHGWVCPYFGGPGRDTMKTGAARLAGKVRRDKDKAAKIGAFIHLRRDSDGTAAINEDLSVPQDCQARAEGIAPTQGGCHDGGKKCE